MSGQNIHDLARFNRLDKIFRGFFIFFEQSLQPRNGIGVALCCGQVGNLPRGGVYKIVGQCSKDFVYD
ncbi:MAG: hypothetical protein FWD39_02475 [Clostridiales bacterium]|nr:hypothetical protein [Clostridiales bacterium]